MESNYFGDSNMGNDGRGTISSGSSRKGKKNSDKPKQPQRGLGVAQLEKIRLQSQMGSSSPQYPSLHSPYQEDQRVQSSAVAAAYSSIPSSSSFSYSSSSSPSSASFGLQYPNMMIGAGEYERGYIRYGDNAQSGSWNSSNSMLESTPHFGQPNMTRHFLSRHVEEVNPMNSKKQRSNSMGSSSQNSESSETQELDLELRLSL